LRRFTVQDDGFEGMKVDVIWKDGWRRICRM